jgi:hypothetical protein
MRPATNSDNDDYDNHGSTNNHGAVLVVCLRLDQVTTVSRTTRPPVPAARIYT